MTDRIDSFTDLQARLSRGDIDRRGYLARLRSLRDAGAITAREFTREIADAQRQVLTARAIPLDAPASRRRPLFHAAPTDTDPEDSPLDKKLLQPGTPTQNIGIEDTVDIASMDDGVTPEPEHRRSDSVCLLRKIVKTNPDASYAASTAKRTAATRWTLHCYEIGPDGPSEIPAPEAEAEARRFLRRVMRAHGGGGMEALLEVGLDSLITDGAVALELDVAPSLDDVRDIVPVDVTKVRFQTTTTKDGQRVFIPVFKPQSGPARPFNLNQFAYSGLDTTVADPHGQPWILPVLDTAPAQAKLRNTVHKVMIHQGFGRLAASVDWDRVAEQMPMTADTPGKKRAYMQRVLGGTTDGLKKLKPDDAVALYDFVKLTVLGAGHGSQSVKTQELVDIYDTDNAAALKTPAAVIGRSVGGALSTNADIHWWIYALSIEALRLHVTRVVSWALSQFLRIRGIPAYCVIDFEPIRKTDQGQEETARKTKQELLIAAMDAGLVDDVHVRAQMGYPAIEGRATLAQ